MTDQTTINMNPAPVDLNFTQNCEETKNGQTIDRNRLQGCLFRYDLNGNLLKFRGKLGPTHQVSALWDSQDQMTAFLDGDLLGPTAFPAEIYRYL